MKEKEFWDKLDICAKIAIPLIIGLGGWYFSYIYKIEQQAINRTQIEIEILKILIKGNEIEKKIAIDFASSFAKKFNDEEFEEIVLQIASTENLTEAVRIKAQKNYQKKTLSDPNPVVRDVAQKTLYKLSLIEALNLADNFYKVEHYSNAVWEYERATSFVPFRSKVNLKYLEEARKNIDLNPEEACNQFRKFYMPLR
ncbi:MAG: hypothetical protein GY928_12255 [Colwellia sp.]|nr:hypothetical protein [Colwellia sp.]